MATIGVQASTIEDAFVELGTAETLRRVTELGYRATEISQVAMTPTTSRRCAARRTSGAAHREGTLDRTGIVEQSLASGAEHLFVEGDDTDGRDPFESLAMSLDHLGSRG